MRILAVMIVLLAVLPGPVSASVRLDMPIENYIFSPSFAPIWIVVERHGIVLVNGRRSNISGFIRLVTDLNRADPDARPIGVGGCYGASARDVIVAIQKLRDSGFLRFSLVAPFDADFCRASDKGIAR